MYRQHCGYLDVKMHPHSQGYIASCVPLARGVLVRVQVPTPYVPINVKAPQLPCTIHKIGAGRCGGTSLWRLFGVVIAAPCPWPGQPPLLPGSSPLRYFSGLYAYTLTTRSVKVSLPHHTITLFIPYLDMDCK